jgi:glucosylceramidase
MSKLAPADRSNIIDTYFNPTKGHMTFARLPIGSCDFSWVPYSYATKADLSDFSIQHDIDSGLIQLIKDAQTSAGGAGHIAFVASPWSAPPFMKDSNSYYTGSLLPADYGTFAQYIAKYVTAMAGQGIPVWAVTPENEPEHTGGFETMGFNPTTEGAFISGGLGAAMAGLNPPIKILGFDHNKGSSLTNWAGGLYGNANVKKYLAGIADHWYGSVVNPFTDSLETAHTDMGPDQLLIGSEQGLSAIHPPIPSQLWMNDAWYWGANSPDWHCAFPSSSGAASCPANNPLRVGVYRVAEDIIASFNHWEAGWIQWNAVTDKWGGPSHENYGTLTHPGTRAASPYMIDACGIDGSCGQGATPVLSGTQAIYDTPTLYILQHFSRFLLPGGKVLQSNLAGAGVALSIPASGGDPAYSLPDMQALAVANPDQTVAVVILNEKTTPVDYAITIGNQAVEGTISASALQTVVLSP